MTSEIIEFVIETIVALALAYIIHRKIGIDVINSFLFGLADGLVRRISGNEQA